MTATVVLSLIAGLLVCLSVLFFPNIKFKNLRFSTYWLIALFFAVIFLIFGLVPFDFVLKNLTINTNINPIKILALFLSMTFLSVYLNEIGVFNYLAEITVKKNQSSQFKIFCSLYFVISILTIFTSNDIIILTFTPFICCFCKKAKINPLPYLFSEFVAANTFSMLLLIGNPTNIYLSLSAGISFFNYLKVMAIPTIASGLVAFLILLLIFRKDLKEKISVENFNEIKVQKIPALIGILHILICIILLSISSFLDIEMWFITCMLCLSLFIISLIYSLITKNIYNYLKLIKKIVLRLPFQLVPFVISMFIIVLALQYCGASYEFSKIINNENIIFLSGFLSFFIANIINNIPMSVFFCSVFTSTYFAQSTMLKGVYASIIGSNICAFFTPVGALAGIMWINILKNFNIKFSFKKFIVYGIMVSLPTLVVALVLLKIIL